MPALNDTSLDDLDVASGMVAGAVVRGDGWPGRGHPEPPLDAMRAVILKGLQRPPCLVSFSGGRDSSSILAVAAGLAEQEGLPAPIPITARFQAEETDEDDWQHLVISHLGINDWVKVDITDELDLLGPTGSGFIRRHGLRYPQNAHFQDPLLRRAAGGSLLSGAGGDELFEPHRWARAGLVLSGSVRPKRADVMVVGAALSPRPVRVRVHHRGELVMPDWLLPPGQRAFLRRVHRWVSGDRVSYDGHLEWWRRSRYIVHGQHSLDLLAADHGVQFLAPFSDDRVLRALAVEQGRIGFASRSDAMRHLFGELLPSSLIERRTKATFLKPLVGPATREFARVADPSKLDMGEWIDARALQSAWQLESVDVRSLLALQLCWLQEHYGNVLVTESHA
jgi:hypothetical protein